MRRKLSVLVAAAGLALTACEPIDWGKVLDALTQPLNPAPDGTIETDDGYFIVPRIDGTKETLNRFRFCAEFKDPRC